MLISKSAEVKWGNRNKQYYIDKGYNFTNNGDCFEVNVRDLSPSSSKVCVECLCDYCLENDVQTVIVKTWQDYNKQISSPINKDCCVNCKSKKKKESDLKVYGVNHTSKLQSTIDKMQETNVEKYGFISATMNDQVKMKIQTTNIERYGVKAPAQNEEVKNKIIHTNRTRYGYVSPTLNKKIREKQLVKMKSKYGVLYPMQNLSSQQKARQSLYKNASGVSSKQQNYVHDILGGELNYPFNNLGLDIAFPNEKIYLECDFGGHDLQVKLGNMSTKEFEEYEKRRWYLLYRNGWKEIRIISKSDKVPSKDVLLSMYSFAISYLNKGHHYIRFDIDNMVVISSQFRDEYNYKTLTRL